MNNLSQGHGYDPFGNGSISDTANSFQPTN